MKTPPTLIEALSITDPADRLKAVRSVEADLARRTDAARTERRRAISELRELGLAWRVIGDLIGVSAQAAERLGATTNNPKDT